MHVLHPELHLVTFVATRAGSRGGCWLAWRGLLGWLLLLLLLLVECRPRLQRLYGTRVRRSTIRCVACMCRLAHDVRGNRQHLQHGHAEAVWVDV